MRLGWFGEKQRRQKERVELTWGEGCGGGWPCARTVDLGWGEQQGLRMGMD